ncbi:MAG: MFS transporter [Omnitrophica bacterium RIFCSPLOWO2_12_FULL_44_17]|uniref:MFS transporter n=1 Tax=Candidatus Danuiimicrobium aquiferis TaxID=1801832 RepID=A0A1G1KSZ7_9BACT|nr:MAG: MFS transporter [Omnitrophica bacterium RIFCSPHIGHO2_02_FULL_45_28]OGW96031.1 MAG: MFS transporter [Omnitrophica bacterium RIFCSPLOWO2_12_FULL_44_17]
MQSQATATSHKVLFLNTFAFTVCFAVWMLNGVLVTFLANNQVFEWGPVETGWLMGIPVLTGSLLRLPAGMLTDKFGGKPVYTILLFVCAVPMYLLSHANDFLSFALCSFGFGLAGVSFAIGVAFTSVWYPKRNQGTVIGIFGLGNAGAALTTFFAPTLLNKLTQNGADLEGWRILPKYYAALLMMTGVLLFVFSTNKKSESSRRRLIDMLRPLKNLRVWRFGLYYFLVFGCFVAFSQWLVPYFVNVYYLPLVTAGIFAASFSFSSGVTRAFGGWLSDKVGPRKVMYWVLTGSTLISCLLVFPKMDIYSPGQGIMAKKPGVVTAVTENLITLSNDKYFLTEKSHKLKDLDDQLLVFPTKEIWQEAVVKVGQKVERKELLAKGVTRIYFQANVWIFSMLIIVLAATWGIGMAAIFKHIPDYFPDEVGVVGGMVGVIGGLGGFFCPILFGYLLKGTGLWTSCWMFMFLLSFVCIWWMHTVISSMMRAKLPESADKMEQH